MLISDLLSPERIQFDVHSSSKKRLLEMISQELARNSGSLSKREVFESLCARERLGSTGLGKGVAIPHGRVKGSDTVEASFIRLKKPLPFDAIDGGVGGALGLVGCTVSDAAKAVTLDDQMCALQVADCSFANLKEGLHTCGGGTVDVVRSHFDQVDVALKIETIQEHADGAVSANGQIAELITSINDIQNSIAVAIEEQSITTGEIGRNVTEAAQGTQKIARDIVSVADAAKGTAAGAEQARQAATRLSEMARELGTLVDQFRT